MGMHPRTFLLGKGESFAFLFFRERWWGWRIGLWFKGLIKLVFLAKFSLPRRHIGGVAESAAMSFAAAVPESRASARDIRELRSIAWVPGLGPGRQ